MPINNEVTTVGIDLGGTKIAAAPVQGTTLIKSEIRKEPTPQTDSSEDILGLMAKMVQDISETQNVSAVGISTAGMVNEKGEMIGSCGNIPGWKGTRILLRIKILING